MANLEGAPEHCPGPESEGAGKGSACAGCPNQSLCSSGAVSSLSDGVEKVASRLSNVKHKIAVLSGKGGVGKSTFTCLLARFLASDKYSKNVGVIDIDICGPSIPRLMGVLNEDVHMSGSGWCPVMSLTLLLIATASSVVMAAPPTDKSVNAFLVLPPRDVSQQLQNVEKKFLSMTELRSREGATSGSYHVSLPDGRLGLVEYTSAPLVQPQPPSFYFTKLSPELARSYYTAHEQAQAEALKKKPTNQATNVNNQATSQSAGAASTANHNTQIIHQASASSQSAVFAQQKSRSAEEVETFEPKTVSREREEYVPTLTATVYYTDVSPVAGPVYTFGQTPLVRILREVA